MATILAYDSGAEGVPAGVWGAYSVSSDPITTERPREVLVSMLPLVEPNANWNIAGWACIQVLEQGLRLNTIMTAVSLAPSISGLPYTLLNSDGLVRSSARIQGFRAVQWNIQDWVGQCRVRVYFIN